MAKAYWMVQYKYMYLNDYLFLACLPSHILLTQSGSGCKMYTLCTGGHCE